MAGKSDKGTAFDGDKGTMLHFAACSINRTGCAEEGSAQAQQTAGRVEEKLDDQPMHNDPGDANDKHVIYTDTREPAAIWADVSKEGPGAHLLAGGASDGGSEDEVALLAVLEDVLDGLPVRLQRDGGGEDPRRR